MADAAVANALLPLIGVAVVVVAAVVALTSSAGRSGGRFGAGRTDRSGQFGEDLSAGEAAWGLPASEYAVFHNLTLRTPRGTTQIDHVIVSRYGVFVIETKHMTGWIFGSEDARFWTKKNRQHTLRFLNPLQQNEGHIKALSRLVRIPRETLHSVVVF